MYVTVVVDADPDIQLAVKSYFTRALRKLPDVVVQDAERSPVKIECIVSKIGGNQDDPLYCYSVVVTTVTNQSSALLLVAPIINNMLLARTVDKVLGKCREYRDAIVAHCLQSQLERQIWG